MGVEGPPQGSALLLVKRAPNAGARFSLDRPTTTAGRHPDSDIVLDDITVSRRHAQFRCVSGEFQIVDIGSFNGTYVNREPVDSAVLANGDMVQIGNPLVARPGEQCVLWDLDERVGVEQPWGLDLARVAAIQAAVTKLNTGGRNS